MDLKNLKAKLISQSHKRNPSLQRLHLYQSAETHREYVNSAARLDKDASPFNDDGRRFSMHMGKSSSRTRLGFYQQNVIGSTNSTTKPVTVLSSIQIRKQLMSEMTDYDGMKKDLPNIAKDDKSSQNLKKSYFNSQQQTNKGNVQKSIVDDAVNDQSLYEIFRTKFQKKLKQQKKKEVQQRVVNQKMVLDQIERLSEIHETSMTNLANEQELRGLKNELSKKQQHEMEVIKKIINKGFFLDLIQELKSLVVETRGEGNFEFKQDTILFSIINELSEELTSLKQVKSEEDYLEGIKKISKIGRQVIRQLVQTNNLQQGIIMELFLKIFLILNDKFVHFIYSEKSQFQQKLERESKEKIEDAIFMSKKQLQDLEIVIRKKKQRIKHLKANNNLLNQKLSVLANDYEKISEEYQRLIVTRPSDELSKLSDIGKGMDKLFSDIESQQKSALLQMDSMAKLLDFKKKEKTPALQKVGVQTDLDYNELQILPYSEQYDYMIPFVKYTDSHKLLNHFQQMKIQKISVVDKEKTKHAVAVILNLLREKLQHDHQCHSLTEIVPFNCYLMHHIQAQCSDQATSYKQLAKLIKQNQQFLLNSIQPSLNKALNRIYSQKFTLSQEISLIKLIIESSNRADSSTKGINFESQQMNLMHVYYLVQQIFQLFCSDAHKDEKHDFLNGFTEPEFLLSSFYYHLGFIAQSGKKAKDYSLKFMSYEDFETYINNKQKDLQRQVFEYYGMKPPTLNHQGSRLSTKQVPSPIQINSKNTSQSQFNLDSQSNRSSFKKSPTIRNQVLNQIHKTPSLARKQTFISKQYRGSDDLIRESVVERDLQISQIQEYLEKITNLCLKKMFLMTSEPTSPINNFKDHGGFFKKIKNDFTLALQEMGRDPSFQVLNAVEFKTFILDKYYSTIFSDEERQAITITLGNEMQEKIRPTSMMEYCKDRGISLLLSQKINISSSNLIYLLQFSFKNLHRQKLKQFQASIDRQKQREIQLNSLQTIQINITQEQLDDISLKNYNNVHHLLTESNPYLKQRVDKVIECNNKLQRDIEVRIATKEDEIECFAYDKRVELVNLNKNSKFKTKGFIEEEYEIFLDITKKMRLFKMIEFKQPFEKIQKALGSQTLEDTIKNVLQPFASPSPMKK